MTYYRITVLLVYVLPDFAERSCAYFSSELVKKAN